MTNIYHKEILEILMPCGAQGMKTRGIVRRIYNLHANFFAEENQYETIRRAVSQYLWKLSHKRYSPIQRLEHGVYAIKPGAAIQLELFNTIQD